MLKTRKIVVFVMILVVMVTLIMPLNIVKAVITDSNNDNDDENKIIRKTTTYYHTRVIGNLNITGDNTYSKDYNSGENYIDGNYDDDEIATIISEYKNDMSTIANSYNAKLTIDEGVSEYYYDVHDEITQISNSGDSSDVILIGDVDDLDSAYTAQGQIVINTIMDKYQTYTITGSAVSTKITGANVTLTAPKVGDKVEKVTKNDGFGEYDAQSLQPTVSTTTTGLNVNAFWVKGLENLSEESFYGDFEEDTYYYAMIDFEAQEGYELLATFPDGIKINGVAPDEVFAVFGGKYNHCIAKIKAEVTTTDTTSYEFLEGANQTYTIGKDEIARFRLSPDFSLFENGGAVYVDGTEIKDFKASSGSTIITLLKDFMSSLTEGKHTLKVSFNNGKSAETNFTVAKESTTTEETTATTGIEKISVSSDDATTIAEVEKANTIAEDTATPTEIAKANMTSENKTTVANNPKTGDKIITIFLIFVIAAFGLIATIKINKARKN